jgi:hypothetical protein
MTMTSMMKTTTLIQRNVLPNGRAVGDRLHRGSNGPGKVVFPGNAKCRRRHRGAGAQAHLRPGARNGLLAVLELGFEILPGKDLQLPVVAVLGRPGHHVGAGKAGTVVGACGDGEVAAFDHPAVVAGELVRGVETHELDVPLAADRLLEVVDDGVPPGLIRGHPFERDPARAGALTKRSSQRREPATATGCGRGAARLQVRNGVVQVFRARPPVPRGPGMTWCPAAS